MPVLRPATPAALADLRALIRRCDLPLAGVERDFPAGYALVWDGPALVGGAGVERHGGVGLLRSVAVAPEARAHGLGRLLVVDRIAWARGQALAELWLLTTTAPNFFARLGFTPADREAAPPAIQASEEFARACPGSAICMRLALS